MFLQFIHSNTYSPKLFFSYYPFVLQKILVPFETTLWVLYPFLNCLSMNSCTSSISSHNNKYTFSFLNTNHSFISIAWSHIFLISILLLAFFPKTWIYLWNLGGTNFLTSFSDFTTSFSSSQISYSSAIFFTSIIHFFFGFSFFSPLFFTSLLTSFLFSFFFLLFFLLFLLSWFILLWSLLLSTLF